LDLLYISALIAPAVMARAGLKRRLPKRASNRSEKLSKVGDTKHESDAGMRAWRIVREIAHENHNLDKVLYRATT
jgi:hypothetical protein